MASETEIRSFRLLTRGTKPEESKNLSAYLELNADMWVPRHPCFSAFFVSVACDGEVPSRVLKSLGLRRRRVHAMGYWNGRADRIRFLSSVIVTW